MSNTCKSGIKIACYIIVPILIIVLILSIANVCYVYAQGQIKDNEEFKDSQGFTDTYENYISVMFNRMINAYDEDCNNIYYGEWRDKQEDVDINGQKGTIIYVTDEYTNFNFLIIDNNENIAYTNLEHTMNTDSIEKIKESLSVSSNNIYWNYDAGRVSTNISKLTIENIKYKSFFEEIEDENISYFSGIDNDLIISDNIKLQSIMFNISKNLYIPSIIAIPISSILLIIAIVVGARFIGLRDENGNVILNWLDKQALFLALLVLSIIFSIGAMFFSAITSNDFIIIFIFCFIGAIIMYISAVLLLETIVKRIKTKTLIRNTLIYKFYKWLKDGTSKTLNKINKTYKVVIYFILFILANVILLQFNDIGILLMIALWIFVIYKVNSITIQFYEIKDALQEIYNGNVEVYLNEENYKGDLKEVSKYVNDIAGGFSNAISEQLKSERMKTELITNVSHDIKTPLTSIINYVDLLEKENIDNENIKKYLEIIDNKSQKLKKLTEDLVEASKASSGNIKLNIERINLDELIKQEIGEFEDKFNKIGLTTIIDIKDKNIYINADGRYIARVLDNIFSNISKYALENSRVYIDVNKENDNVLVTFKNISREKLNISEEELMQRFVRGDESRNTEGSGLGLSISESLTKLQGGEFEINIDGDLFKVMIIFKEA